ncbi:MAG: 2-hydroxycyclohexanecarboxyl-CoA dehydrogenase [Solirubrobacteraceae bacterium]|jgi:2-hydroxycyclohexanecarboxyl-CoA dehydrogenase|nr:2-hydroxycyclohexanecarboxyl-CoA dehydrogenase [Solirubrobacteraceae bacterium]
MSSRAALVTGGARGIGRAIALRLGEQGHPVAVADLAVDGAAEVAASIEAAGGRAIPLQLDVTDSAGVLSATSAAAEELGPIEVLVNNAGWDDLMPFVETDEPFWDRVIDINYKGVLRLTSALLPGMLERQWGRIVNIGSDAARVGSSHEAVYAGAKGAVIAFTKTIARESARRGVTANVVCPGPTDTPLLGEIVEAAEDSAKVISRMTSAVPMKRVGQPYEIAAAVAFLAGEDAGFITGQTLSVSGGLTMA